MKKLKHIKTMLKTLGIPTAYDHFEEGEGPDPPFICYRSPESSNFAADGKVYLKIEEIDVELYTDEKDPEIEERLETLLTENGYVYQKTEAWIESEKLYEVLYEFEEEE